jgi:hypothetical protein
MAFTAKRFFHEILPIVLQWTSEMTFNDWWKWKIEDYGLWPQDLEPDYVWLNGGTYLYDPTEGFRGRMAIIDSMTMWLSSMPALSDRSAGTTEP